MGELLPLDAHAPAPELVEVEVAARAAAAREIDVGTDGETERLEAIGLLALQRQRRGAQDRRVDLEPAQVQAQHVQVELDELVPRPREDVLELRLVELPV